MRSPHRRNVTNSFKTASPTASPGVKTPTSKTEGAKTKKIEEQQNSQSNTLIKIAILVGVVILLGFVIVAVTGVGFGGSSAALKKSVEDCKNIALRAFPKVSQPEIYVETQKNLGYGSSISCIFSFTQTVIAVTSKGKGVLLLHTKQTGVELKINFTSNLFEKQVKGELTYHAPSYRSEVKFYVNTKLDIEATIDLRIDGDINFVPVRVTGINNKDDKRVFIYKAKTLNNQFQEMRGLIKQRYAETLANNLTQYGNATHRSPCFRAVQ